VKDAAASPVSLARPQGLIPLSPAPMGAAALPYSFRRLPHKLPQSRYSGAVAGFTGLCRVFSRPGLSAPLLAARQGRKPGNIFIG